MIVRLSVTADVKLALGELTSVAIEGDVLPVAIAEPVLLNAVLADGIAATESENVLDTDGDAPTEEDVDCDGEPVAVLDNVCVRERLRVRENVTVLDIVGDVGVGNELGLALSACVVDRGDGEGVDVSDTDATMLALSDGELDSDIDSVTVCARTRWPTRLLGCVPL